MKSQLIRIAPLLSARIMAVSLAVLCMVFTLLPARAQEKIVSVDGTISEILCRIGLEDNIVGVDVTSTYPASLQKVRKVGHNRSIGAEGILSLGPDIILVNENTGVKPETIEQLKSAGKKVKSFSQEYSTEGTKKLIREVSQFFNRAAEGEKVVQELEQDLRGIPAASAPKKILFVYARGTGTMMVAGENTSVDKIIGLSGNKNAVTGFKDFKPLTTEALVAANPDAILLFNSGLESISGVEGILKVPGVAMTNAGKNRKIIAMDGLYLTGFGPRVGKAIAELAEKSK